MHPDVGEDNIERSLTGAASVLETDNQAGSIVRCSQRMQISYCGRIKRLRPCPF